MAVACLDGSVDYWHNVWGIRVVAKLAPTLDASRAFLGCSSIAIGTHLATFYTTVPGTLGEN